MQADAPEPQQALPDRVYERLTALVMDHEIEPGARVSIEGVSRMLDVSPTPVREALARLEADGLVTKRSQASYRVAELLTLDELADLFEMRLLLEPHAAQLAATRASDSQLDELESVVEQMRVNLADGPGRVDSQRFAVLDQEFHDLLTAAAGRPLLLDAVRRLHAHLHMFRLTTTSDASELTVAEHERILRAILRRSPERAARAMAEHLQCSRAPHEQEPTRVAPGRATGRGDVPG